MKLKLKKKPLILLVIIIVIIVIILIKLLTKPTYDKKRIISIKDFNENTYTVTIKNTKYKDIDSCTLSNKEYHKLRRSEEEYNKTIGEYRKTNPIDMKTLGILYKNKILTDDSSYTSYITEACGFDNIDELLDFYKEVMKDKKKYY